MDLVLSIIALILSIAALCLSIYRYTTMKNKLYKKQQIKDFVSEIIELQETELDNAIKEEKEKNNKQE